MRKFVLACLILMLVSSVCMAGKKKVSSSLLVDVDWGIDEPVSIFCAPDGSGYPLTRAFIFGGTEVDATLTVTLATNFGPQDNIPAEDILLVPGYNFYHLCGEDGAICGTGFTDEDGVIVLDGVIAGGGYSDPSGPGARIEVITYYLSTLLIGSSGNFPLYMNSPDINGDGVVNLLDITIYSSDKDKFDRLGKYNYRSDFNWDGILNDIDQDMLYEVWGASCP